MDVNPKDINFLQDAHLQSSQQVYDGEIMQVYQNKVKMPDGQLVNRDLIHHSPAVAIIATRANGDLVLVQQYRHGACKELLEIPAGIIDYQGENLEDPLLSAQRELEEECQLASDHWQALGRFYVSPGYLNEYIYLYRASQCYPLEDPRPGDQDEFISLSYIDGQAGRAMLESGEILDMKTALAVQLWLQEIGG